MKINTFVYQYARSFVNNCSHFQAQQIETMYGVAKLKRHEQAPINN